MRPSHILPVFYYCLGITALLPLLSLGAGAAVVLAAAAAPGSFRFDAAAMCLIGLVLIVLSVLELYGGIGFLRDYLANPRENWRSLFPRPDTRARVFLAQSRDAADCAWILLFFLWVASAAVWAAVAHAPPLPGAYEIARERAFLCALLVTVLVAGFKAAERLHDRLSGRARLVIPCRPFFTGMSLAGAVTARREDLRSLRFTITLAYRNDLKRSEKWRETITAEAVDGGDGLSRLDFAFSLPAGLGGIYQNGIIWYLLVRPVDGLSNFHCRFSNLPVFPSAAAPADLFD